MSAGQNASLGVASSSLAPPSPTISDREKIKIEFYDTYDAMTGIRIAATLGGFFGLMVILVVYKSKSKTERALENPNLAAAAVAQVEEEDQRQIQAAIEATCLAELGSRPSRRSLDVGNSPVGWVKNTSRFSSIGGYSSLMEPPIRSHSRLPCFIDEDSPAEDEFEDLSTCSRYLDVPRRSSNITCSSSGSSYLERRGSSILGLPILPAPVRVSGRRRQSSPLPERYDLCYPIDIRVIQPTPGGSPCGSERALYESMAAKQQETPRRAPLASISSCNSSLGMDYPDFELQSLNSDSVFHEDDCPDTEDEADPFSTDSEASEHPDSAWCRRDSKGSIKRHRRASIKSRRVSIPCISENIPVIRENRENDLAEYKPSTSSSKSGEECRLNVGEFRISVSDHGLNCKDETPYVREKSLSVSEGSTRVNRSTNLLPSIRLPDPLPSDKSADSLTLVGSGAGSTVTLPTLPLVERSPSAGTLKKEGSWSQETLF